MSNDAWADALAEVESPERRDPGLWARSFAEQNGDDLRAKAAYVRYRVGAAAAQSQDSASRIPVSSEHNRFSAEHDVVTTQLTSKRYKAAEVIGVVLILSSGVSCAAASRSDGMGTTAALLAVGAVVYFGARLGAWWNHG